MNSNQQGKIFELLQVYNRSRENINLLVGMSRMADYEKVGFIDVWQEEMAAYFERHGYCFACNLLLDRCRCEEPLNPLIRRTA